MFSKKSIIEQLESLVKQAEVEKAQLDAEAAAHYRNAVAAEEKLRKTATIHESLSALTQ